MTRQKNVANKLLSHSNPAVHYTNHNLPKDENTILEATIPATLVSYSPVEYYLQYNILQYKINNNNNNLL